MVIALDFDGTIVTNDYPKIGRVLPNCIETLHKLIKKKHNLILLTQRDNKELTDAIDFFGKQKIKLFGINNNPEQNSWNKSRKVYADLYIDDRNLGCPLTTNKSISSKPFVDWIKIENMLKDRGIL